MTNAVIRTLFRYPVKGMTGERLDSVQLEPGETMPWDRAFAVENGPSGFDPANPAHLPKIKFLMLMRDEALAKLTTRFDDSTGQFTISDNGAELVSGCLNEEAGRSAIETFLQDRFSEEARGAFRILRVPGHSFSDLAAKVVHLVNLNSLRDLEQKTGQSIDPLRFRANIYVDGLPAWAEFDWIDKTVRCDDVTLKGTKRTKRCAATNVNPETAERDRTIPRDLLTHYEHTDCGIYLDVIEGGLLRTGETITVQDN